MVATGNLFFQYYCQPEDSDQDNRCFQLNPSPASTSFDVRDIDRVTLPANAAKNIIYPIPNFSLAYEFENRTGVAQPSATFQFSPHLTIESVALTDPRTVDDQGIPLNGRLDHVLLAGLHVAERSLGVGERQHEYLKYSRMDLNGLQKSFFSLYNLPPDIADRLLREPMTIRLNFSGVANLLSDNEQRNRLYFNLRLVGN